ncbi:MAG: NAD(P)H-hydrate dehydratase [Verrucomicrobia bacterium]|nr:MAG: NAD(P)H-hydrate dehydratase [Verrucomicrobiota bacterium]
MDLTGSSYADPILSCAESSRWEEAVLGTDLEAAWRAMNAAGAAVGDAVLLDRLEISERPLVRTLVLVGKGHNGGDALIALRRLFDRQPGLQALVVLAAGLESLKPLTRRALEQLNPNRDRRLEVVGWRGGDTERLTRRLESEPFDLCLDGLLGMQFKPPLRSAVRQMVDCVNSNPGIDLRGAVDLPSGLGDSSDAAPFRADFTYATGIAKAPVVDEANRRWVGRIRYLDIGFFFARKPASDIWMLKDAILDPHRRLRPPESDKRTYGHVFILTGSRPYPGALLMSVRAALRSGAGLVTAFAPESLAATFAPQAPEAMWVPWPETLAGSLALEGRHLLIARRDRCSSLVVGPGLGCEAETLQLVTEADAVVDRPIVVDADALQQGVVDALADRQERSSPIVATPHHGEFKRISGLDPSDQALRDFSRRTGIITCLKGPVTRISDGDRVFVSPFGGPVLARGGSGDLLAGILGTTLADCPGAPLEAACRGVVWHGRAADCLSRARGQVAVQTTEILDHLATALRCPDHGS